MRPIDVWAFSKFRLPVVAGLALAAVLAMPSPGVAWHGTGDINRIASACNAGQPEACRELANIAQQACRQGIEAGCQAAVTARRLADSMQQRRPQQRRPSQDEYDDEDAPPPRQRRRGGGFDQDFQGYPSEGSRGQSRGEGFQNFSAPSEGPPGAYGNSPPRRGWNPGRDLGDNDGSRPLYPPGGGSDARPVPRTDLGYPTFRERCAQGDQRACREVQELDREFGGRRGSNRPDLR